MTPISFRFTAPQISGVDRAASPRSKRDARDSGSAGARPPAPTRADLRAAVEKLGSTGREAVAAVSRSSSIPSPEPEVVVARAIASGQAQSLGAGVTKKLKDNPTFDDAHVGMLTINGQAVQVNTSRDSLARVVASINAFSGVSASLDSHSGLVTIVADRPGATLQISDESGFLDALGIETGTVNPSVTVRRSGPNPTALAATQAVDETVAGVNGFFDLLARTTDVPAGFGFEVLTAVREAVAGVGGAAAAGVALTSVNGQDELVVDTAALSEALKNDPHALDRLLSGPQGLPEALRTLLARDGSGEVTASRPPPPPHGTIVDGRRLLGTRSVFRDVGVHLLVMQRFTQTQSTASRFEVLA